MTAKDKAKDIYNKFDSILPCEGNTTKNTVVECGLILIDEILDDCLEIMPAMWMHDYWREVKSELQKL